MASAGALTVKLKLPSIGCASGAATIQRTPTTPSARGSSNRSVQVRLSLLTISSGVRMTPLGSSTTNPSPAGVASPANVSDISDTASSMVSPSAGEDDSNPVWAAAGIASITSALAVRRRNARAWRYRAGRFIGTSRNLLRYVVDRTSASDHEVLLQRCSNSVEK